ncbi:thioredoxin-like protein [Aspergillus ambiguus]|uniref:thioredoxin peroxidase DOT5 n=1 Tax=Aspergillus ambiguus TaxID=176160 RepID=UPI003CCCAB86
MVELRKRKAATQPPVTGKKNKKAETPASNRPKEASQQEKPSTSTNVPKVGDTISLDGFGGEIETNDGTKTTLKTLVEESKSGVVLFTYPRASTPGCTKQACMFRDNHDHLTSTGLSIFGLSSDSPKANTTFKTKQNLQYPLICDPSATLIAALGLKKSPKGTVRGVFAVDKKGTVLLLQAGGPDATVTAVQDLVNTTTGDKDSSSKGEEKEAEVKDNGQQEDAKD